MIFIVTHQSMIIIFFHNLAIASPSFAKKSVVFVGSSPLIAQNQPKGIAFSVYSVPSFPVQSLQIRGGKPIPNSLTLTHVFLAACMCHRSCDRISSINIRIHTITRIMDICIFEVK